MKRLTVHTVFALLAAAAAATVAVQALRLHRAQQLNAEIAAAARLPAATPGPTPNPGATPTASAGDRMLPRDAPAEARLARATALAAAGEHDAAFRAFSALVTSVNPQALAADPLARQALYNLGNLVLRQALVNPGSGGAAPGGGDTGPLVELAKQRFRDLLRADPTDWDARYNLERALRLAPEQDADPNPTADVPAERRQVQLRGMEPGDLP